MSISQLFRFGCCVLLTAAVCWAANGAPVTVSPGTAAGTLIGDVCPTFIWGAVPEASAYELVVYRVGDQGEEAEPMLSQHIAGSAFAWTPSLHRCLERGGHYAWSIRAMLGSEASDWSSPSFFQIASGPSAEEFEHAIEVVRQYLATQVVKEVEKTAKTDAGELETATSGEQPPSSETKGRAAAEATGRLSAATTLVSVGGNVDAVSFTASSTITSGTSITIDGGTDTITASGGTISFDNENLTTSGTTTTNALILSGLDCTTNANGGALTADASGAVSCSDDASGTGSFGAWISLSDGTVYQAATDGLVVVLAITTETMESRVAGYTDSSFPPGTKRMEFQLDGNGRPDRDSFTMPVRKGDYWTVTKSSSGSTALTSVTVGFLPVGN